MQETLQLMEKYVNLPSGPWAKEDAEALTCAVAQDFEQIGMLVESIPCQKVGPVLQCTWGHGPKRLLLLGHLDTVFPREERQPFRREGNCVYGSGIMDMKSGIAVMRQALKAALPQLDPAQCSIVALMNCDEEIGSPESGPHIVRNAKECFATLSFEPCKPGGGLTLERKGVTAFHIKCTGIRGHAGAAYLQCASAIQAICQCVTELYTLRDDARSISLNIGAIQGGSAENVVCDEAEARGEFRYYEQAYQAELMEKIQAICDAVRIPGTQTFVSFGAAHPALARKPESVALFEKAQEIGAAQGRTLVIETSGGAGDIGFVGQAGIPALDGLGIEGKGAHTVGEVGFLESLPQQIELAEKMILHLLG